VHSGSELKESSVVRSQVAGKAHEIEGLMAAFMGMSPPAAIPEVEELPQQQLKLVA
jgi:hypothetical protein